MYLCITDLAERARNSFQDIVLASVIGYFVLSAAYFSSFSLALILWTACSFHLARDMVLHKSLRRSHTTQAILW